MNKTLIFANRTFKEVIRDRLNLIFGLGFPLAVLLLFNTINANIPFDLYSLSNITPGVAVFGLSFICSYSGLLVSKDRQSSFILRLFTAPLKASNFIFGYSLPFIPIAAAQSLICFVVAMFLGLSVNINVLFAIISLIPMAIINIAIGVLCGSLLNEKQVNGLCGALLINLSAWLSGAWFDLKMVGGLFEQIANLLPFAHAVKLTRLVLAGNFSNIYADILWLLGYALVFISLAVWAFSWRMNNVE